MSAGDTSEVMSNGKIVMCLSTDNKMPANTNTRPLSELSVVDVGSLLDRLDISEFKAILVRNKIDGKSLVRCSIVDEVKEMGIHITVKAKLLFEKIREFQVNGAPMEYVQSSTQVYCLCTIVMIVECLLSYDIRWRYSRWWCWT